MPKSVPKEPVTPAIRWDGGEKVEVPVSSISYDPYVFDTYTEASFSYDVLMCLRAGRPRPNWIPVVFELPDGSYVIKGIAQPA